MGVVHHEVIVVFHLCVVCTSITNLSRFFSQEFSSHDNVIQLIDVIKACNDIDIYLVFEFMDTDLHAVIKAKILKPVHIQYIMYQVRRVEAWQWVRGVVWVEWAGSEESLW